MRENFQLKNMQGITLIALVITIIVLLILATVSIRALTGDNGLITKAREARTSTQVAGEKEQILLAVNGSWDTDGELKADITKANLRQIQRASVDGDDFPFTVTYEETGNSYNVIGNGEIVKNEELTFDRMVELVENGDVDGWGTFRENWTKPLYYIGEYYNGEESWDFYRYKMDDKVYVLKYNYESGGYTGFEKVNLDGTIEYDEQGNPAVIHTPFGNYIRGDMRNAGEFTLNHWHPEIDQTDFNISIHITEEELNWPEFIYNGRWLNYDKDGFLESICSND